MDDQLAREGAPAVALFIFNRPDTTREVFARIAAARPRRLLIVADGPRASRPDEARLCRETRAVVEQVDWDCDVRTNFADENLGCRARVSSGVDWVFSTVDEAIILEDDCLPDPTFFRYCAELLARYRDDDRIALIGGVNVQPPARARDDSYYYSQYAHIWGWASWRRAWRSYDVTMANWPAMRPTPALERITGTAKSARGWRDRFDAVHAGTIDTWDYQLVFANWSQHRLCITPGRNLVSNIGFRADATHTSSDSELANLPSGPMTFPLRHPPVVVPDFVADRYTQRRFFDSPSVARRARSAARRILGI